MQAASIKAWRYEQLINDLALGDKPDSELASEYEVEEQSIRVFRLRHKADVNAKKADWASQYGHIWSTKVENRLRLLTQRLEEIEDQMGLLLDHARRETELIRTVDPEASEVPVNGPEWRAYEKEQRALLHEIADQTGGLPARLGKVEVVAGNPIFADVLVEDSDGNLHPVQQSHR
jgi:hypothetical protein